MTFVPHERLSESIIEQMVDVAVFDHVVHVTAPQMLTEFIEVMRSVPQKRVQRADEHFVDGLFLQVVEEIVVVIQTFAHGHISGRNAQQCLSCKHKVLK